MLLTYHEKNKTRIYTDYKYVRHNLDALTWKEYSTRLSGCVRISEIFILEVANATFPLKRRKLGSGYTGRSSSRKMRFPPFTGVFFHAIDNYVRWVMTKTIRMNRLPGGYGFPSVIWWLEACYDMPRPRMILPLMYDIESIDIYIYNTSHAVSSIGNTPLQKHTFMLNNHGNAQKNELPAFSPSRGQNVKWVSRRKDKTSCLIYYPYFSPSQGDYLPSSHLAGAL